MIYDLSGLECEVRLCGLDRQICLCYLEKANRILQILECIHVNEMFSSFH